MKRAFLGGLVLLTLLVTMPLDTAYAADMAVKAPQAAPLPCAWCGFYLGINGGGVWDHRGSDLVDFTSDGYDLGPRFPGSTRSGGIGGVQFGYNWRTSPNWLVGVEGDFDFTSVGHSNAGILLAGGAPFGTSITGASDQLRWLSSARARLGYTAGHNLMAYVTGGAAWSDTHYTGFVTNNLAAGGGFGTFAVTQVKTGWVAGAGIEYMAAPRWALRAEYLHYGFAGSTFITSHHPLFVPGAAGVISYGRNDVDVARVGVSYLMGPLAGR